MALLTVSVAAVGLAASTLLVTASSAVDPADAPERVVVCKNLEHGHERTLPSGSRCLPRTEVEVAPSP